MRSPVCMSAALVGLALPSIAGSILTLTNDAHISMNGARLTAECDTNGPAGVLAYNVTTIAAAGILPTNVTASLTGVASSCGSVASALEPCASSDNPNYPKLFYCAWQAANGEFVDGPLAAQVDEHRTSKDELIGLAVTLTCTTPDMSHLSDISNYGWDGSPMLVNLTIKHGHAMKLGRSMSVTSTGALSWRGFPGASTIRFTGMPAPPPSTPPVPPSPPPSPPKPDIGGLTADDARPDCYKIKEETPSAPDGKYYVLSSGGSSPTQVWCDMTTDGGGWTISTLIKQKSHWDWEPKSDAGTLGSSSGWNRGGTLASLNQNMNERIIIYLNLWESGQGSLGKQWMSVEKSSGTISYTSITNPGSSGWVYTDSLSNLRENAGNTCSHGCSTYRGMGMFHDSAGSGWHGTQGGDYGCRDGNNICWQPRGFGCNVGSSRCAYLTGDSEGVMYGYRWVR